jgi:dienelactone hydrolase
MVSDTAPAPGLAEFERTTFTHGGTTKTVFAAGSGPAVLVMHELPGITPELLRFALRLAERGFRVVVPWLFGIPGKPESPGYIAAGMVRACLSRELHVFAANRSSPIADWLRALAQAAHRECGGPGVGAIGMCITGSFVLALAVDPWVEAPIMAQPALPWSAPWPPALRRRQAALHVDAAQLAALRQRTQQGLRVLAMRFAEDWTCPAARFARLRAELGQAFEAIEIGRDEGTRAHRGMRHGVLTTDLVDGPGEPTREALERVLAFLVERLKP